MNAYDTRPNAWHNPQSYLPEPEDRIAWNDLLFGAACGLLVGMIATVGLASIWAMFL